MLLITFTILYTEIITDYNVNYSLDAGEAVMISEFQIVYFTDDFNFNVLKVVEYRLILIQSAVD